MPAVDSGPEVRGRLVLACLQATRVGPEQSNRGSEPPLGRGDPDHVHLQLLGVQRPCPGPGTPRRRRECHAPAPSPPRRAPPSRRDPTSSPRTGLRARAHPRAPPRGPVCRPPVARRLRVIRRCMGGDLHRPPAHRHHRHPHLPGTGSARPCPRPTHARCVSPRVHRYACIATLSAGETRNRRALPHRKADR